MVHNSVLAGAVTGLRTGKRYRAETGVGELRKPSLGLVERWRVWLQWAQQELSSSQPVPITIAKAFNAVVSHSKIPKDGKSEDPLYDG